MFTPGFRIFGLFSLLAMIGAVVYGIASGDTSGKDSFGVIDTESLKGVFSLGWQGGIGEHLGYILLIFLAVTTIGLGIVLMVFRDANAKSVAQIEGMEIAPKAQTASNRNFWPVVMALGLAIVIVGLVTSVAIVIIGIVLSAIAIFQWAIFAWSERLTGDPVANQQIRNRVMAPIEIPILGAAIIAILALGSSRVFLAVSEFNAVWVGAGIAIVIFSVAIFLAVKPKISQGIITSILAVAALGVIVAGIVYAAVGSREVHHLEKADTTEIVAE